MCWVCWRPQSSQPPPRVSVGRWLISCSTAQRLRSGPLGSTGFASDAVGIITVAPLVIGLAEALRNPPPRNEIIEGVAALVALAVVTIIIISLPPEQRETVIPVALLFPILLWITARCQPVFAAAAAFIVSLTVVWTITFGIGPFGDPALRISDSLPASRVATLALVRAETVVQPLF